MAYTTLHDNIALPTKDHDFTTSLLINDCAWGVVCDGVSNSYEQAWGAQKVALTLTNHSKEQIEKGQAINYEQFYGYTTEYLNEAAKEFKDATRNNTKSLYATTVITGLVEQTKAEFSYCGNGAIMEIRQQWFDLPEEIPTPWGINNYLNPHSRFIDGENKLFKVVKATEDISVCMPDVVRFSRDEPLTSYYIICSDGLYSSDEISTGWDEQTNQYYVIEGRRLIQFLQLLKKHHHLHWKEMRSFTQEFRTCLTEGNLLVDDLSYVLFIPEL